MKQIISYFIKYPITANLLMGLILIFGLFGLKNLKSTFFPQIPSRMITVQANYPGASPEEMEKGIVLKIEDNLKGLEGIDRVTSVSKENSATISIEVKNNYNPDIVLQDVKNAVDRISSFPDGLEPPVIFKQQQLNQAINFAISGPVDLRTLKRYARQVEDDLRATDLISQVELSGFPEEEIEITFRESDLLAHNLNFSDVSDAVRKANIEITGGMVKGQEEEMLIRAKNKEYYAEDLRNIVIKSNPDGSLVRLKDVAGVENRWADNPNRSYLNQQPAVVVNVSNTVFEDILDITDYVRNYIDEFNEKNDVVQATVIRDSSINLRQRIDLLVKNGLIGFSLVIILLSLFLNIRLAMWVAIAIPISFAGMFIFADFYDLTINVISLFGMILVIGILVDDGIVISENIYQRWERGEKPLSAAVNGTLEVLPAVFAAIMTTIVAFSVFFFLEGRIGEFISDMAFVVIFTLIFSLVEGAFILPSHIGHSKALQGSAENKNRLNRNTDKVMNYFKFKVYSPTLKFLLKNHLIAIAIATALFIITIGGLMGGVIKTTFFPNIERDNISVNLEMPAGTTEEITSTILAEIEEAAWRVNAGLRAAREDSAMVIEAIEKKIGPGTNTGSLNIILMDTEKRNLQSFQITNMIREEVGEVYGAEKVEYGVASPFGKPVSISLMGSDIEELEAATGELKNELSELASLKDVVDNNQVGLKEINIKLKDKAYLLGLDTRTVLAQVRNGFFGNEVQRLQRGLDEVKVWVRYGNEYRSNIGNLENMRIKLPNGNEFPLREIADLEVERGIMAINHLDGRRVIRVEADLGDPTSSATEIMEEVQTNILPDILNKYPSISIAYEGQRRETDKTAKSGQIVFPIILIIMFALVLLTFRSFMQTLAVFIVLPLGLIGVGWGHFIHGDPISILSVYGVIALLGIMVNDSLVLVSALNINLKGGKDFMTAIYDAGMSRFRPILLTSLTTVAGLAPLILEKSFQAQFLVPMAISVAYGLIVATFITLFILPVGLVIFNRVRVYWKYLLTGKKPNQTEVEPAVKELHSIPEEI